MRIFLCDIYKKYDNQSVLNGINTAFGSGLTAITGKSGSGKTTLIKLITGEVVPDSGKVLIGDQNGSLDKSIAYSPVDSTTIDSLMVVDNLKAVNSDTSEIDEVLTKANLFDRKKTRCSKLSKGEQARVCIARALLMHTPCIVLDEPTANLDQENAEIIFELLKKEAHSKSIIIATHDEEMALKHCDFVYGLENGNLTSIKAEELVEQSSFVAPRNRKSRWPIFKIGIKKTLSKKMPFIISNVLLSFTALMAFSLGSLYNVNRDKTIKATFSKSSIAGISCSDERINNDILDGNQFSIKDVIAENSGTAAPIFTLAYKDSNDVNDDINSIRLSDAKTFKYVSASFSFDTYSSYMDGYENVSYTPGKLMENYFPILLSVERYSYITNSLLEIIELGDVIPYYFDYYNDISFRPQFVFVGTYQCADDFYPSIIPDDAIDKYYQKRGIPTTNTDSSILEIITMYNDYVLSNNLPDSLQFTLRTMEISERTIANSSLFGLDWYKEGDELPMDESLIMYVGKLPTERNEIMIPNREIYSLLSNMNTEEQTKAFFDRYSNGYPAIGNEATETNPSGRDKTTYTMESFDVVGYYIPLGSALKDDEGNYIYNADGTEKRNFMAPRHCPTILSDHAYEEAYEFYVENLRFPGIHSVELYSPAYLSQHIEELEDFQIGQRSNAIDYSNYYSNIRQSTNFFAIVSGIVLVLGMLVDAIYTITLGKELVHAYDSVKYWGVAKKEFLIAPFTASLSLTLVPALIGLVLGIPFFNAAGRLFFQKSNQVEANPICDMGWGFLTVLALFLASYLIIMAFVLISMRRRNSRKIHAKNK